jgi:F-type H+-transporting ATPase subunit b
MITAALDRRSAAVRAELDEAARLREEAQSLLAEYQRKAREAGEEAETIIEQARREAAAILTEAQQRSQEQMARRTRMAEEKITRAEAQALQEVRSRSADVAIAIAEHVLAARAAAGEGRELIERSISEVRARLDGQRR